MKSKFETLLLILGLIYKIERQGEETASIGIYDSAKKITLKHENDIITIYDTNEQAILVLSCNEPVGKLAIQTENLLLENSPIAYTTYVYYMLLGAIWSLKASPEIADKDPAPDYTAYTLLLGRKGDEKYRYEYVAKTSGEICITKKKNDAKEQHYSFSCKQYIEDPENIITNFIDFFDDIDCIESVGKG